MLWLLQQVLLAWLLSCRGAGAREGVDFCTVNLQLQFLEIRRAIGRAGVLPAYFRRIAPYFHGNFPKLGQLNCFQKSRITVKFGHIYRCYQSVNGGYSEVKLCVDSCATEHF